MALKIPILFIIILLGLLGLAALVAVVVGVVILLARKKKHTAEQTKEDTTSG